MLWKWVVAARGRDENEVRGRHGVYINARSESTCAALARKSGYKLSWISMHRSRHVGPATTRGERVPQCQHSRTGKYSSGELQGIARPREFRDALLCSCEAGFSGRT